jgi:cysteine desulfurase/selenocysteine lyase
MQRFGVPATTRASFAFYNSLDEIEVMARALQRVVKVFG